MAGLLARVDLFAELSEQELADLARQCSMRSYDRDAVVWSAGDEAHELLVVATGEFEVRASASDGRSELLGTIRSGECVGEMALVLDERRSATVVCSRRAEALVLDKEQFRLLARSDARLLGELTKLLSRRAFALAQRRPVIGAPLVVGVAADPAVRGASLVAGAVTRICSEMLGGRTLLVRVHDQVGPPGGTTDPEGEIEIHTRRSLPPYVDLTIRDGPAGGAWGRAVERVLRTMGGRFSLVIVDFPQVPGGAAGVAEDACDRVIRVVGAMPVERGRTSRVFDVVNCLEARHTSSPLNHCEPFILPVEPRLERATPERAVRIISDGMSAASRVLARLARKILGATVGIALGGGGAFGIAHVGVLSALTEAGLPIDLVAGTSMGSIVAIGYAAGISPSDMEEIAGRIGNVRTALSAIDPSLTGTGLLNGQRLVSIFGPLLPHTSFDELTFPCRVVAMDVETGERVDIGSGRLDNAFRASCSIPVVFKPVRFGERTVVDGGMIDPVPADVAREMGADVVVAINVVPHLRRGVSTAISRTFKRVNRLNPLSYLAGARNMPDIVDVLMNSLQMTEYELGNFKSLDADVLINVDMAEFTWIDFHRAPDIVKRGHEAGVRAAPKVGASLKARLAPLLANETARL